MLLHRDEASFNQGKKLGEKSGNLVFLKKWEPHYTCVTPSFWKKSSRLMPYQQVKDRVEDLMPVTYQMRKHVTWQCCWVCGRGLAALTRLASWTDCRLWFWRLRNLCFVMASFHGIKASFSSLCSRIHNLEVGFYSERKQQESEETGFISEVLPCCH